MVRIIMFLVTILLIWSIAPIVLFIAGLIWLALAWQKHKQRQQLPLYRRIR